MDSRRRSNDAKSTRSAALEQLRNLKERGGKYKYEPESTYQPVYDVVDEDEYSEHIKKRQEESDWIVSDPLRDGGDYMDDGREIFDEVDDENSDEKDKKNTKDNYKSKNPNVRNGMQDEKSGSKGNIKKYFGNASKKMEQVITSADDEELLKEALTSQLGTRSIDSQKSFQYKEAITTQMTHLKPISKFTGTFAPKSNNGESPFNPFSTKPIGKRPQIENVKENSPTKLPPPQKIAKLTNFRPKIIEFPDNALKNNKTDLNIDDFVSQTSQESKNEKIDSFDSSAPQESEKEQFPIGEKLNFARSVSKKPEKLLLPEKPANFFEKFTVEEVVEEAQMSNETLGLLKFYLLDVYEDVQKNPGTVYLFGRTYDSALKTFVSCAIIVKNIERRLLVLPRERVDPRSGRCLSESVTLADVYEELKLFTDKLNIPKTRTKTVKKKYSIVGTLSIDAPAEAEYLEVRYGFNMPSLPTDLTGETFSGIFGMSSSALELFLIERNIKGPRWLEISDSVKLDPAPTWCPAYVVNKISQVKTTADTNAPPLKAAILKIQTMPNRKNQHEVVCASLWSTDAIRFDKDLDASRWQHFCVVAKSTECAFPLDFKDALQNQNVTTVEIVGNERALLNFLLAKIQKLDPDIILGHDLISFELETMIKRIQVHNVPCWSRFGRLRRTAPLKSMAHKSALIDICAGRLICDISIMARELIKAKDYDLNALSEQILQIERPPEILPEMVKMLFSSSSNLMGLISRLTSDAYNILSIANKLKCLPLAAEISRIVGGVFSKTLMGGRSERTEFLLLHALEASGFVFPEKPFHGRKKGGKAEPVIKEEDFEENLAPTTSKKAAYAGGLVLEPKKGLYDQMILLLDFNSLYPSIMQEFNICFTTINLMPYKVDPEKDSLPNPPDSSVKMGILPTEIRKLVESRKAVKKLMQEANVADDLKQQYSIRQQALKLTANSMYGCLGFSNSRFYAKPLAALITSRGREILMDTKELVESMGLEVIYGDTDSIMINTNRFDLNEVMALAKTIKTEVNKKYCMLELDIDGVFKQLLLLKKKKYAGLLIEKEGQKISCSRQVKGLDIVRRDWSQVSIESGDFVLDEILSENGIDEIVDNIHKFLTQLAENIKNDQLPKEKYLIKKQLTKDPNDYGDKKSLAHVSVAVRLNGKGRKFKQGDVVSYVICEDGTNNSATQRAYDLSEMDENKDLKIDVHYYLGQQVHPVVSRLCEPIQGTDAVRIAECLGLDSASYRRRLANQSVGQLDAVADDFDWSTLFNTNASESQCLPFEFQCADPDCGATSAIRSAFIGSGDKIELSLAKCSNEKCKSRPYVHWFLLVNRLQQTIRKLIAKYYHGWMQCEDVTCGLKTRKVHFRLEQGQVKCPACKRNVLKLEVTEKQIFDQLTFFQKMFNLNDSMSRLNKDEIELIKPHLKDANEAYLNLLATVQHYIQSNGYSQVDLGKIFHGLSFEI